MGFEFEEEHKQNYIQRLTNCVMSPSEAYRTYHSFLRDYDFSKTQLEDFLSSRGGQNYVDKL